MIFSRYNNTHTEEIIDLFNITFSQSENLEEGKLIAQLVSDLLIHTPSKNLYAYIASESDVVIGSVIFSRIVFEQNPIHTFILSPMAIHPDHQRKGIGTRLITYAHSDLKKHGVELVLTYGDIRFYKNVGYAQISTQKIPSPLTLSYPKGWLAQSLTDNPIPELHGTSSCVTALNDPVYW